jgi:hypothetical protein
VGVAITPGKPGQPGSGLLRSGGFAQVVNRRCRLSRPSRQTYSRYHRW